MVSLTVLLSGCTDPDKGKPTPTVEVYQPTRSVATVFAPTQAPACTNVLSYSEISDLFQEMMAAPGENSPWNGKSSITAAVSGMKNTTCFSSPANRWALRISLTFRTSPSVPKQRSRSR